MTFRTSVSSVPSSPGCWWRSRWCSAWCRTTGSGSTCSPTSTSRSARSRPSSRGRASRRWRPRSPSRSRTSSTPSAGSTSSGRRRWKGSRRSPCSSCSRRTATSARRRSATRSTRSWPTCPTEPNRRSSTSSTPASMPVMTIAVSGRRDFREVTEIARKQIKERLETVNGVGAVTLVGGRVRAMNVVVDAEQAVGLQPVDRGRPAGVDAAEPGSPRGPNRPGPARAGPADPGAPEHGGRVQQPDRRQPRGLPDPAQATSAAPRTPFEEPRTLARLDGNTAVSLVIQKQSGMNTVKVVDDVKARLDRIRPSLAAGYHHRADPRPVAIHQEVDRGGEVPPPAGRASWSRRRSCCSSATGGRR